MKLTIYKNSISSSRAENELSEELGIEKIKSSKTEYLGLVVWCNDELGFLSQSRKGEGVRFDGEFERAVIFQKKQDAIKALLESSENGSVCVVYTENTIRNIVVLLDSNDFKKEVYY